MKDLVIRSVSDEVHLKFRLLCTARGFSGAKMITEWVMQAWLLDETVPDKLKVRKMKKIIKRFGGVLWII